MFIDYDKLITAIKYVSRMSKMTIRAYAKHKAHVYNDILFMLRRKLKTNEDIKVKELTKIINGYGLVADRFVYLDKIPRKEKFNPETDLKLEKLQELQLKVGNKKLNKTNQFNLIPKFNRPLYTFNDYMNYLRGVVLYLRRRYKNINVEFYSTFAASTKQECTIFITLNKNKTIHLIFRHTKDLPMVCLDMRDESQPPLTLLDKAFKKCNFANFQRILRFIDREILINKELS